ncbi:MAG TPA: DUF6798 domain-containing protein [Vicinamibacteria bacterium]|nr:DUF6798 domain-containing protein [Vicinamibacteria bacterium]
MDPGLYPGDVMVATAERFPTVFYRALAAVLPGTEAIPAAFFVLYLVAVAATLAGAWRIGRWAGGPAAGALALLFAFPVRIGLAGESLYRVAFSHSHLASALAIWAMVWFLEGRRVLPLLVLSLGAYNHLLYSVYVLVPMVLVVLWEAREAGRRRTLQRLAAAILPLLPLAAWTLAQRAPMTPEWLALLRLRSAHHSFPSAFAEDLPQAAALLALSALALSRLGLDRRRLVAFFLLGTALQFVVGTLFTEIWPVKAVLQYQPHRAWRFLMLLLQGVVAAGVVAGWREGGLGRTIAVATGVVMFTPGLEPLLAVVVLLQAAAGRPTPAPWARLLAAGVLVVVTGWADREVVWTHPADTLPRALNATVLGAAALAVVIAVGRSSPRTRTAGTIAAAVLAVGWLTPKAYASHRQRWESGAWRAAQNWVRVNTPRSAVLLSPPHEAGFRVFSERTIVGEWKDGTQQYFDDAFVREWGERMEALGDDYEALGEDRLLELARRYGASYIVLPRQPPRRGLALVYRNPSWAVYRTERVRAPAP